MALAGGCLKLNMKSCFYRLLAVLAACFATPWATWHQRRIRASGRRLNNQEMVVAEALSLSHPDTVFIHVIERVPNPLHLLLCLARSCGASFITEAEGITLGSGIYVDTESAESLELIAHELVHVRQYQRVGSIWSFMVEYLYQCLMVGYFDAEWEMEARRESAKIISSIPC